MCPENVFPLLCPVKTITAICFAWLSEIMSAFFCCIVWSFRAAGFRTNFTHFAPKVRLFLYFEGNVPPKCFPAASPCKDDHGYMLCMAIWNNFSLFCYLDLSFTAAGFRTKFTLFRPKNAIISLFWRQWAPKMFPRSFTLRRRTRQYALHGYLK